jgi:hypothetical protein
MGSGTVASTIMVSIIRVLSLDVDDDVIDGEAERKLRDEVTMENVTNRLLFLSSTRIHNLTLVRVRH